nr:beta-1,3-galactosyltransferase 1-like [Cherax quadricarinatus]
MLPPDGSNHEYGGLSGRQMAPRGTGQLATTLTFTPPQPRMLAQAADYTNDEDPHYKSDSRTLEKEDIKLSSSFAAALAKQKNEDDVKRESLDNKNEDDIYNDDDTYGEEQDFVYDWYEDNYKKYKNYVKHNLFSDLYNPRYIIENTGLCKRNSKIFVFINSRVTNTNARQAIRDTYLRELIKGKISYGFLISNPEEDLAMQALQAENSKFGDVIVVGSQESYPNLTLKTAHMMHWTLTNCPDITYIAKVDDDVYVNVARFLRVLNVARTHTIIGKVCSTCVPFRGSHVPLGQALREFGNVVTRRHMPLTTYPSFTMGPAYVITTDIIPLLVEAAQQMVYFSYEDVFWTGLAAEVVSRESGMNVGLRDDPVSIKMKYHKMGFQRLPAVQVKREDVSNWRVDRRFSESLQVAIGKAQNAVTVHNVNWDRDKQFVSALQRIRF